MTRLVLLLLLAIALCSCARGPGSAEKSHRAFRALLLPQLLTNDQLDLSNDLLERAIAKLQGKRWRQDKFLLHSAAANSDILRSSIDSYLDSAFPSLPRIPLDEFADRLDAGIRASSSPAEARALLAQLEDLRKYAFSLDGQPEPFVREIARRAAL